MYNIRKSQGDKMDIQNKLRILSDAAKYDVSCSSSGSNRKGKKGMLGDTNPSGICHSFTTDGRCISLLKILFTNCCIYDCSYCINRVSNDVERATFTPREVADLTINFYKRNYIEGLFLSSAIIKNPDYTMELLYKTLYIVRKEYGFNGYIHVKAIPGASYEIIRKTGYLADRMSVNIELPNSNSLKLLAPQKKPSLIIKPMNSISKELIAASSERKIFKNAKAFVPAGQSTQLIIGATPDSDHEIISLSEKLYSNFKLKRVYFSAYMPINKNPLLPKISKPPLLREHRLYQADWLLRFYGFNASELLKKGENIDPLLDPKSHWAINNLELFPMEINKAPYEMLIRIPGIGLKSAEKIISARFYSRLSFDDLKKMGVVLKKAKYFILASGRYYGGIPIEREKIYGNILDKNVLNKSIINSSDGRLYRQLSFFEEEKSLVKI